MRAVRSDFLIERSNLRSTTWRDVPSAALEPGQVRLRIDRFALTANNITYAVFGDKLRYWEFFPAPEGFGRLPVWGFAEVEESRAEGVSVGERVFGYLPISTELVVSVGELSRSGFSDASPWREELSAVYNRYLRVTDDPAFAGESLEALQGIFRLLFATSFLIDGFLAENDFFGARSVLVSSASSKTSLALGYLLKQSSGQDVEVVGLTSASNSAFVTETGYYDRVVDYEDIGKIAVEPAIFVDMAGSGQLQSTVHHHFGDALRYSCAVGRSHWEGPGRSSGLPGPRPTIFLAYDHVDKQIAKLGVDGYEQSLADAWDPFCKAIDGLLEISYHTGHEEIEALYHSVLEGKLPPRLAAMAIMQR